MFIKPSHLDALTYSITREAEGKFLFSFARRHKLAGILEGYNTNDSLWDRLVFEKARSKVMGDGSATLRGIVVSGENLSVDLLTPSRIALSIPFVNTFIHPLTAAPIFATHPHDLQTFAQPAKKTVDSDIAHVGPPTVNIEVKILGVNDDDVEKGGDPVGQLHVRGPIVGRILAITEDTGGAEEKRSDEWIPTGYDVRVQKNGSFKVRSATK